eukprot:Hpha_TRINITY_DN8935_c0_g1::TRINITY_DN8935_c0_g1_i2::g.81009::m.81009/K08151/tetA; MFS transporter, DHA1 family, tetracycline resistance protein
MLGKADAARWKGVHMAVTAVTGAVAGSAFGAASDSGVSRNRAMVLCLLLLNLCHALTLAGVIQQSIVLITAGRLNSLGALLAVFKATVADASSEGHCQLTALAHVSAAFGAALIVGPGLGALVKATVSQEAVFIASLALSALALLGALLVPPVKGRARGPHPGWFESVKGIARDRLLLGVVCAYAILKDAAINATVTISVYTQHRYNWRTPQLAALMSAAGLSAVLVYVFGARWVAPRRRVHLPLIFAAAWWGVVANVLYGLAVQPWILVAAFAPTQLLAVSAPVLDRRLVLLAGEGSGFALGFVSSLQCVLEVWSVPLMGFLLGDAIDAHKDDPQALQVGTPYFVNVGFASAGVVVLWITHHLYGRNRTEWIQGSEHRPVEERGEQEGRELQTGSRLTPREEEEEDKQEEAMV